MPRSTPSVRKALVLSFAGKYSALAMHTVAVMVLARLLTPAEIGVYSVGAAVVGLAHVVRDFGVGNYLIQEKELTTDRVRTAFAVTLVIGWTMAAVLFALSGPVSAFYDEPGLGQVLRVLSLTFLVIPFSSPVLALLRRDMAFGRLYVVEVASAAAHVTTGISLAALGYGFLSLAWASLAGAVMTATVAALYRPSVARNLPSFKEWRRVASFGSLSTAASIVSEIAMAAPDLIIGRLLGFAAVGLFSRAMGIIQLFNRTVMNAVTPVVTATLAAKNRRGEDLLEPYLKGLSYVTVLAWPFFIFLGLMAYPIIRVLFGDQWDEAVPLVQILCLAGIFRPLFYFVQPVFIALGQVRTNLRVAVICNTISVLFFFLGALHSLEAAAAAPGVFCLAYFAVSYVYLRDLIGLSLQDVARSVSKSAVVALLSGLAPGLVFLGMDIGPGNILPPLLIALAGTALSWIGVVFAVKHPLREELVLFRQQIRRSLSPQRIGID